MNLKEELLAEHSKTQALKIASYIGNDKNRFKEFMQLFLGTEYRVTQRAAWVVSFCCDQHPDLIKPYIKKMVDNLEKGNLPDAVKRNTLRVLQEVEIPEQAQGKLFDVAMKLMLSMNEPIAVKAFAVFVLFNISKVHPELQSELKMVLEDLAKHAEAPALKHRYNKVLKELKKGH